MEHLSYEISDCIAWYTSNDTHDDTFRARGPCVIYNSGVVYFSQIEKFSTNRVRGPSIIYPDGYISFNMQPDYDGVHRTDGPAVILADGSKEYWVDDNQLPEDEFFLQYGVL